MSLPDLLLHLHRTSLCVLRIFPAWFCCIRFFSERADKQAQRIIAKQFLFDKLNTDSDRLAADACCGLRIQ